MIEVSIYCWNCGGQEEHAMFARCSPADKNMGESCCPECGTRKYALWEDLIELSDRQTKRGIPRL